MIGRLDPAVLENCLAQAEDALSLARGSSKVRGHIAAQDATIKALADVLWLIHIATAINPSDSMGAEAEAHFTERTARSIAEALRLAGRLPRQLPAIRCDNQSGG